MVTQWYFIRGRKSGITGLRYLKGSHFQQRLKLENVVYSKQPTVVSDEDMANEMQHISALDE